MKTVRIVSLLLVLPIFIIFNLLIKINNTCSSLESSIRTNECQLSFSESDGFVCESNEMWNKRKYIYHSQDRMNMMKQFDDVYFERIWEPNFHCANARRVGVMGDGGKWICDVYRLKFRSDCLIYSFGLNKNSSFETNIKRLMPHCEIHTFRKDAVPCEEHICVSHRIPLGNELQLNDSRIWPTIVTQLNHTKRSMEILVIDIDGAEYAFVQSIFNLSRMAWPRQISIVLHPTKIHIVHGLFDYLRLNHYVIFSKVNRMESGPYFFEYSFLKLNSQFFM